MVCNTNPLILQVVSHATMYTNTAELSLVNSVRLLYPAGNWYRREYIEPKFPSLNCF